MMNNCAVIFSSKFLNDDVSGSAQVCVLVYTKDTRCADTDFL